MICFIPIRSGSKSIPDKNIKLLGGKPLVAWTIESAQKAGFQRIIVNTDSEAYAKIAREAGAEVMIRPAELAQDNTSMFEVLKNEIPKIVPVPEIVILLQATTPFREVTHIKAAISYLINSDYDSIIAAERVPEQWHPAQVIVSTPMGLRMASGAPISQRITRRQDFPNCWVPTGSIYGFKTANLEKGSMYGERTMVLETPATININTMADWEAAEKLCAQK